MGVPRPAAGKTPGMALILSFLVPGVGQIYNGDTKKGGVMLGFWLLSWFLVAYGGLGFITGAGIWIWAMIDAYNVASGKTPMWS
jgi:TM2 domain-containing membrane protein YozV